MKQITSHEELLAIIGKNLRQARQHQNYKIATVAKELEVNISVVSQIENGKYQGLNIRLLHKLSVYLDVAVSQIFAPSNTNFNSIDKDVLIELLIRENSLLRTR